MNYCKMDNGGLSVNQGVQIGRNIKELEKIESMHKKKCGQKSVLKIRAKGVYIVKGGHGSKTVRGGGRGVGFGMAVGQQGWAVTRIAPHLPGFISARG
jgi:hypothetical protein